MRLVEHELTKSARLLLSKKYLTLPYFSNKITQHVKVNPSVIENFSPRKVRGGTNRGQIFVKLD